MSSLAVILLLRASMHYDIKSRVFDRCAKLPPWVLRTYGNWSENGSS